jgi:hypothetical protein
MDISEKKPEDVLKPAFIQKYKELHEDIWHRLVEINTSITILEKIQEFPFSHFYYPPENAFWSMVYWNFTYTCVVLIHTLVNDQGENCLTIQRFKNLLLRDWLADSEKQELRKKVKSLRFEEKI